MQYGQNHANPTDFSPQRAQGAFFRRIVGVLLLLGMIGPFVLLCIMAIFGLALYNRSIGQAEQSLMAKAVDSNLWAAQFAARTASDEIDKYFSSVHRLANDPDLLVLQI